MPEDPYADIPWEDVPWEDVPPPLRQTAPGALTTGSGGQEFRQLPFMPGQRGAPTTLTGLTPEEAGEVDRGIRTGALASGAAALTGATAPLVWPAVPRTLAGAEGARQGYETGGVPGAVVGGVGGATVPLSVSAPVLGAAAGYDVAGTPGAVGGAVLGAPGRAFNLLGRLGRGALAGGVAGSVPVLGAGAQRGAQLGIASEFGQGGLGALWKHAKQMKLIQQLSKMMGGGPAAEMQGAQGLAAGQGPMSMPAHIARQIDEERTIEAARRALQRVERGPARMGDEAAEAFAGGPPAPLNPQQLAATEAAQAARAGRAAAPAGPIGSPGPVGPAPAPAPTMAGAPGAARVAPVPGPAAAADPLAGINWNAYGGDIARRAALRAHGRITSPGTGWSPQGAFAPAAVAPGTGPLSPLVLKAQQVLSQPGGRETVMAWLKTQPREVVEQILPLLKQGASTMPTTF